MKVLQKINKMHHNTNQNRMSIRQSYSLQLMINESKCSITERLTCTIGISLGMGSLENGKNPDQGDKIKSPMLTL